MPPLRAQGRVIARRYNLVESIGRGAMGVVWRARDSLLDRDVAIKEVFLNGAISDEDRENAYKRTMREARTAARLSHRGVVTIYDVAEEDGRPWIIMEYVPSRSLDQVLRDDGPLPPRRACRIGQQLLAALASAHAANVLHRDVKPSNVLIADDPDGERAVLTDFGIAQFAGDPRLTQTGMVMGSPGFTAPERIRGGIATPASDLWSLGATLFAAVEGHGPYEKRGGAITTMTAIINEDAPTAGAAGPLAPLITALLHRNPRLRPPAAAAARMFAGVLPLLPQAPSPARRTSTLASPAIPGKPGAGATSAGASAAGGTAQDAVPDSSPAADTVEGIAKDSATEVPTPEVHAPEVHAPEVHAPEVLAEDAAEVASDGAAEAASAVHDTSDDATAVNTALREASSPDAEDSIDDTAGGDAGGGEAADVGTADAETSAAVISGNAQVSGNAEHATADADETARATDVPADADPSEAAGIPAILRAAVPSAADDDEPTLVGKLAPVVQPALAGGPAGLTGQPAFPVRSAGPWPEPPTQPQPPFGPGTPVLQSLTRRRRRGQQAVVVTVILLLAAVIGTVIALAARHDSSPAGTAGKAAGVTSSAADSSAADSSAADSSAADSSAADSSAADSSAADLVKAIDSPVQAPPADWSTHSVAPADHGTPGGFTIAVPPSWTVRQRALSTFLDAPAGVRYLDVDLTRHDRTDILAEAAYVEHKAIAQGHLPGYHRLSLRRVTIRKTAGAFWSFTWVTPGGVTMEANDLLFSLRTTAGPQSYAVDFTAPAVQFPQDGSPPLFNEMLRTFQPVTN